MTDPRTDNCKAYREEGGYVTGVELVYTSDPNALYQLAHVELIDERQQGPGGPTVAFFDRVDENGLPTFDGTVVLTWIDHLGNRQTLPPGTPGQHVITTKYSPPDICNLEIQVNDANGNRISDVIRGFGLPNGHHVSWALLFAKRGAPPPPDDGTDDDTAIAAAIVVLSDQMQQLGKQLDEMNVVMDALASEIFFVRKDVTAIRAIYK